MTGAELPQECADCTDTITECACQGAICPGWIHPRTDAHTCDDLRYRYYPYAHPQSKDRQQ